MGGFSAQVQQPQTNQPSPSMGKGGGQPQQIPDFAASYNAPGGPGAALRAQPLDFAASYNAPGNPGAVRARADGLDQNAINANPAGFEQWQQQRSQQPMYGGGGDDGGSSDQNQSIQPYTPPQAKPMGKGGMQTNSATSGQPRMGMANQYPNTVGVGDNTKQQPMSQGGGKGKG
jgi:hypothetical protein